MTFSRRYLRSTLGVSQPSAPIDLREFRQSCKTCSLSDLCLPVSLNAEDVDALDRIVQRRKPLAPGSPLYRSGASFSAIYAVRTGAFKASLLAEDGREQITAFYFPGELMALDAIAFADHPSTAIALETSSVCEIPFEQLGELSRWVPGLQRQLLRIMSREIFSEHEVLQSLASRSSEQRLAIVLLNLGDRLARRGLSADRFQLPMSRQELSNYLGLTPETMSRLFKRFVDRGWINASGREVEFVDREALRRLSASGRAEEPG